MKKNASEKVIFYGELDRFGYTLQAVGETKEAVKKAILAEYVRAYKDVNGEQGEFFEEDYQVAKDDLWIDKMELNKVQWR